MTYRGPFRLSCMIYPFDSGLKFCLSDCNPYLLPFFKKVGRRGERLRQKLLSLMLVASRNVSLMKRIMKYAN